MSIAQQLQKTWQDYCPDAERDNKYSCLNRKCESNWLTPTTSQIHNSADEIVDLLKNGDVKLVVPMKEQKLIVRHLLNVVANQMPGHITVIDNDSSQEVVNSVSDFEGVSLIDCFEVLSILDWDRLLPLLNLTDIPQGKGVAVMAGYLANYIRASFGSGKPKWIMQHDADVAEYEANRGVEYLAWGMLNGNKKTHQVKMAQSGRGNESCMTARNVLAALGLFSRYQQGEEGEIVARRAKQLFDYLYPYKWLLSGQFAITWDAAINRPFATGYLEETLTCVFMEEVGELMDHVTTQVANPHRLADGENDYVKEGIMEQLVSNFMIQMAFLKKPVMEWGLNEIANINQKMCDLPVALIPPEDSEPVHVYTAPSERIIPSVKILDEEGFIDWSRAKNLFYF